MSASLNYLGQLRIYSLIDLIFILLAVHAHTNQFIGATFLWLGFLAFLEYRHRHSYRVSLPNYLWIILWLMGLIFYQRPEGLIFIGLSYLYSLKVSHYFGLFSPIIRGSQNYFLVAGIASFLNPLAWLAFLLIIVRNLLGDWRDADKDRAEQIKTVPVLLGFHSLKYVHLLGIVGTTTFWWSRTELSISILFLAIVIEAATYDLTPR